MSNKPTLFYKYHSLNNNLFKLLKHNAIWFSSRKDLNDLFEGRFNVSEKYSMDALEEASEIFLAEMQAQLPLFYQFDSNRFFQIIYTTLKEKNLLSEFNSNFFYSETNFEWFVCCFTTKVDNNAMWAHYADSNKGVCLAFDFSQDIKLLDKIHKVDYEEEMPVIETEDDLKKALLLKKKDWRYEDEWRILSETGGSKKFKKECLKAIYFGERASKQDVRQVISLCEEYGYYDIEFKRPYGRNINLRRFR